MKSRLIFILIGIAALGACTTVRPVYNPPSKLVKQLTVGDHLVIYEKSGRIVDMKLTLIDGNTLLGTLTNKTHTPVKIKLTNIKKVEVEKVDGIKTTLAVAGSVGIVAAISAIVLVATKGVGFPGP